MTFRTRLFVTSAIVTAVTLALATALVSWDLRRTIEGRTERALVDEARLAAETLAHRRGATPAELDGEADAIGKLLSARITFINQDGGVVGDSEIPLDGLAKIENHGDRPEIQQAKQSRLGIARRYSATIGVDMLYVAVPVSNPQVPALAFVRLALPLVEVRENLAVVRRGALMAFGGGLVVALALAWIASLLLARRIRSIAAVAQSYAAGDLSNPMRDYGDDEIGTVARHLDSSVRSLAKRMTELDADRARTVAILSGMVEGVLVVDENGRLRLVNDAVRRMLRVQPDWQGRHYFEVIRHPDVAELIAAALRGLSPDGRQLTLPRDPGITLVARAAPVASTAGPGAVLVLHDITDLRRADQMRRDFVANVSHELRTPLTSIRGYLEALMDGTAEGEKAQQFLETIARHATRMERLVKDLLRLARLDARQEPLERGPVAVEGAFAAVVTELTANLSAREQTVDVRVADGAQTVNADPAKLHDALRNLLENASRHAPERSTISMTAERRGPKIALIVADEGPGIPEPEIPRVFERFYRVDKGRTRDSRESGGTGLGLSIVKHLVELHGGTVTAANRPEGGALFTIEMPAD